MSDCYQCGEPVEAVSSTGPQQHVAKPCGCELSRTQALALSEAAREQREARPAPDDPVELRITTTRLALGGVIGLFQAGYEAVDGDTFGAGGKILSELVEDLEAAYPLPKRELHLREWELKDADAEYPQVDVDLVELEGEPAAVQDDDGDADDEPPGTEIAFSDCGWDPAERERVLWTDVDLEADDKEEDDVATDGGRVVDDSPRTLPAEADPSNRYTELLREIFEESNGDPIVEAEAAVEDARDDVESTAAEHCLERALERVREARRREPREDVETAGGDV